MKGKKQLMIYIICFAIAILFAYVAEKTEKKWQFYCCSILAILIPSLLAGLRSTNIGTDVNVYVVPAFNVALKNIKFIEYMTNIKYLDLDFLYSILTYFVARISSSINVFLFIQHLIICILFYIGAVNFKEKSYPFFTYGLFLFMYYNTSLNIIRQFFALAIVFFALKYIESEKPIKYIISIIVATLFHSTAIIAVSFYIIYMICQTKRKKIYLSISIIILIIALLNYNQLLGLLAKIGIIASKYVTRYAIKDINTVNIDIANSAIRIYTLILTIYQYDKLKKDKNNTFYTIIAIYDLIILQIGAFVQFAYRISIYLNIVSLVNISRIIKNANDNHQLYIWKDKIITVRQNKKFLAILTYLLFLIYFIFTYIIVGSCQTYPYQFLNL